jgi:hypothetical protein
LNHYLITDFDPADETPDIFNNAGNIVSKSVWQWNLDAWQTVSREDVEMIQCASFDFDQYFVRADLWFGHISVLENFRATMTAED